LNIGERKKEIATLGVLGYREEETLGYIYREILMMSVVGVVLGILLGIGLLAFVLFYLEFGAIADVKWYSYLLSFVIVMIFVGVTDLLLSPKILKIDMTASLKSNE
jgi:putative ABC transport system permease protein